STRSKKPASAKAAKLSRIRPIIRAPSSVIPSRQSRSKGHRVQRGLQPPSTHVAVRVRTPTCSQPFLLRGGPHGARAKRGQVLAPTPPPKSRLISPIFTADSVSLHVSP